MSVIRAISRRYIGPVIAALVIITASITGSILIEQQIAGANRSHQNFQAQIDALNKEVYALQHPATSSSQAKVTQQFIAEFNYVCSIEADYAAEHGLPAPSPGLCALTLPAPSPSPTTAPRTSPSHPPAATTASRTPAAKPQPTPAPTARPTPAPTHCVLGICV